MHRATSMAKIDHPISCLNLPRVKITLAAYRVLMRYPAWNQAIALVRQRRRLKAGIRGARMLLELTEKFRPRLSAGEYSRNSIKINLFLLDTLRRCRRRAEYAREWLALRQRTDLTIKYRWPLRHGAEKFLVSAGKFAEIHFLYLRRNCDYEAAAAAAVSPSSSSKSALTF
jgi:hypothetical protein